MNTGPLDAEALTLGRNSPIRSSRADTRRSQTSTSRNGSKSSVPARFGRRTQFIVKFDRFRKSASIPIGRAGIIAQKVQEFELCAGCGGIGFFF